jgi:hypothetical protein
MNLIRLANGNDFFELGVQIEEDSSIQSFGDAYVTIQVQSEGFAGHNDLWVLAEDMRSFARNLVSLEASLIGEARLESISPNELSIKVRSVSGRGNLSVEGTSGYEVRRDNSASWHSVSFGFEFEPSQLSGVVRLPWIQRFAG